mmetsp:Transcript_22713/g.59290  ORF Transcript_22713/g.59290 Transcript_22713/m.59290 type:complete len:433 (-) Transcript_22713:2435-3733(-)
MASAAGAEGGDGGAWQCTVCTYAHALHAELTFLACALCGAPRVEAGGPDLSHSQHSRRRRDSGSVDLHRADQTAPPVRPAAAATAADAAAQEADAPLDPDVAFVRECCGGGVALAEVQRAVAAAGGSVERAVEAILSGDGGGSVTGNAVGDDVEIARLLQQAEEDAARMAWSDEEADRRLAESLAAGDDGGGAGASSAPIGSSRPASTGSAALWTGKVTRRKRNRRGTKWQWESTPSQPCDGGDTPPTRADLQEELKAEFGLGSTAGPDIGLGSAAELRDEQRRVKRQQIAAAKKATAAYRSKSGLAGVHSVESGRLAAEHATLAESAVAATFRQHNTAFTLVDKIDLHGLYVAEAIRIIEQYLRFHEDRFDRWGRRYPVREVVCVTGRGKHSQSHARLKPALVSWLNAYGYGYRERGEGRLNIWIGTSSPS